MQYPQQVFAIFSYYVTIIHITDHSLESINVFYCINTSQLLHNIPLKLLCLALYFNGMMWQILRILFQPSNSYFHSHPNIQSVHYSYFSFYNSSLSFIPNRLNLQGKFLKASKKRCRIFCFKSNTFKLCSLLQIHSGFTLTQQFPISAFVCLQFPHTFSCIWKLCFFHKHGQLEKTVKRTFML